MRSRRLGSDNASIADESTKDVRAVRSRVARGMSLMETTCAVAFLGIVLAFVMTTMSMVMGEQTRLRQKLAAAELANRLIISYLDDETSLPEAGRPIEYTGERFRWRMRETPARLIHANTERADTLQTQSSLMVDRLQLVSFDVWLSEESGGATSIEPGVPNATLARLVDPLAMRNADSVERLFRDRLSTFQERITRFNAGSVSRSGQRPTGSTPSVSPSRSNTAKPATSPSPSK
jgi:type II secretory pathway pseudopilin PulG